MVLLFVVVDDDLLEGMADVPELEVLDFSSLPELVPSDWESEEFVFMELCPESLLESASNLVFELLLVVLLLLSLVGVAEEDVEELDAVVDCMDDLAELDLAELSAIIELEDDMAPSSVDS